MIKICGNCNSHTNITNESPRKTYCELLEEWKLPEDYCADFTPYQHHLGDKDRKDAAYKKRVEAMEKKKLETSKKALMISITSMIIAFLALLKDLWWPLLKNVFLMLF